MENKELKKPIPVELDDDALDTVSGGTEPSQNEEVTVGMPIDPYEQHVKLQFYSEYIEEAEKRSN